MHTYIHTDSIHEHDTAGIVKIYILTYIHIHSHTYTPKTGSGYCGE